MDWDQRQLISIQMDKEHENPDVAYEYLFLKTTQTFLHVRRLPRSWLRKMQA